jgi:hypothetical protein
MHISSDYRFFFSFFDMQDYAQQESDFQAGIPPRLISIFYSVFDPSKGPMVVFEVPEGSIISTETSTSIIDFDSISEYIIPKQQLCGHLVSICTESYKIMGFPVYIEDDKYKRNAFMFNLSFVFERDADTSSYEPVVRKVARVLTSLEVCCYNHCNFLHYHKLINISFERLKTSFCQMKLQRTLCIILLNNFLRILIATANAKSQSVSNYFIIELFT